MSSIILPYMLPPGEQLFLTESYVSSPPAMLINDQEGHVWTLGTSTAPEGPRGEYAFDVLKNGEFTGEVASRIERRAGRIRIFTAEGMKRWNGRTFI